MRIYMMVTPCFFASFILGIYTSAGVIIVNFEWES